METDKIPRINPDYSVEAFEGEILLYTEEEERAVYLNNSAYAVWLMCKEGMTIGRMINCLKEIYPGMQNRIKEDVESTLEMFAQTNVIEFEDDCRSFGL